MTIADAPANLKALLLVAAFVLSGCLQGPADEPDNVDDDGPEAFDGQAAHAWVEHLLERSRVPGTDGHNLTKAWLAAATDVPGWNVTWHNFTGAEYLEMDLGEVAGYVHLPSCTEERLDRVRSLEFSNLVARWDNAEGPTTWVAAHWDAKRLADEGAEPGVHEVPGANDGASGVAVAIQLMHHIAAGNVDPDSPFGILLFDGEDGFADCHPLAGSVAFAQQHEADVQRLLLLDMVGDPEARFIRETHSGPCGQAWQDEIWSRAPQHGLAANFVNVSRSILDDHVPFTQRGLTAVDLIDYGRPTGFPPYWHSKDDTLDKVDADMLGRVGSLVADVIDEPAALDCPTG